MSVTTKLVLMVVACMGIVAGGIIWHSTTKAKPNPAHAVVIYDRSDSKQCGCDCVVGLAKQALTAPNMGRGSKLVVTATGDETTANEPIEVVRYDVPSIRGALEQGDEQKEVQKVLDDLKGKCNKVKQTTASPIALSIKRGIEQLKSLGCNGDSQCSVYAETDLEETADMQIKGALNHAPKTKQTPMTPIFQNDGISILICGVSETTGLTSVDSGKPRRLTTDRDPQRADRIREVWKPTFTQQQLVSFSPFCPKT